MGISVYVKGRHRKHANPFSVRGDIASLDLKAVYAAPEQPIALDIGFGEGGFLLELAQRNKSLNVLGLEIRKHFVEQVNVLAKNMGLTNAHAVVANANVHLGQLIPDRSVAFAAINFPDPWYKKKHHKRRVVCPEFMPVLLSKLCVGAQLHVMSDYEPIAEAMRDVLYAVPQLKRREAEGWAAESTTGIMTEREIKHTGRGEPIYRMSFERIDV